MNNIVLILVITAPLVLGDIAISRDERVKGFKSATFDPTVIDFSDVDLILATHQGISHQNFSNLVIDAMVKKYPGRYWFVNSFNPQSPNDFEHWYVSHSKLWNNQYGRSLFVTSTNAKNITTNNVAGKFAGFGNKDINVTTLDQGNCQTYVENMWSQFPQKFESIFCIQYGIDYWGVYNTYGHFVIDKMDSHNIEVIYTYRDDH